MLKDEDTSEYSIKIDVYSFGIICWQLFTCRIPYVEIPGSVLAVAEAVLSGHRPAIPSDCPTLFAKIMKRCWHESALRRPSFDDIVQLLEIEMAGEQQQQQLLLQGDAQPNALLSDSEQAPSSSRELQFAGVGSSNGSKASSVKSRFWS